MAFVPSKSIRAEDASSYFAALALPTLRAERLPAASAVENALKQMYGYFGDE